MEVYSAIVSQTWCRASQWASWGIWPSSSWSPARPRRRSRNSNIRPDHPAPTYTNIKYSGDPKLLRPSHLMCQTMPMCLPVSALDMWHGEAGSFWRLYTRTLPLARPTQSMWGCWGWRSRLDTGELVQHWYSGQVGFFSEKTHTTPFTRVFRKSSW